MMLFKSDREDFMTRGSLIPVWFALFYKSHPNQIQIENHKKNIQKQIMKWQKIFINFLNLMENGEFREMDEISTILLDQQSKL